MTHPVVFIERARPMLEELESLEAMAKRLEPSISAAVLSAVRSAREQLARGCQIAVDQVTGSFGTGSGRY